jgi:hypothetical protein
VETVKVLAADSCVDYLFLGEPTLGVCRFDWRIDWLYKWNDWFIY